jgi:polyphosphate glucokinase
MSRTPCHGKPLNAPRRIATGHGGSALSKRVLVVDVGGTNIKVLAKGQDRIKIPSGPQLTPKRLITEVRTAVESRGWEFDVISIGVPAPIADGRVLREPANLGRGWTRFDFSAAAAKPVKVINDAALQALGSYEGGTMLFLGLGTGLGSVLILDGGVLVPLELARLPFRKGEIEDYVGLRGLQKRGKSRWRALVTEVATKLRSAFGADDLVLGGGHAKLLKEVPEGCRLGSNAFALVGGERLWSEEPLGVGTRRPRGPRAAAREGVSRDVHVPLQ